MRRIALWAIPAVRRAPYGLVAALLLVRFADEWTTFLPAGALEPIRRDLGLTYAEAAGVLVALPAGGLVGTFFVIAADYVSRRWLASLGALAYGLAMIGFGLGHSLPVLLAAAFAWGAASDAFVHGCEVALVDLAGDELPKTLARMNAWAAVGDLLGPLTLALAVALGFGWRGAFVGGGALMLGYAAWLATQRLPPPHPPASLPNPFAGVWAILKDRRVLVVAVALGLYGLLDEPLAGFLIAYLERVRRLSPALATAPVMAILVGGMGGFAAFERIAGAAGADDDPGRRDRDGRAAAGGDLRPIAADRDAGRARFRRGGRGLLHEAGEPGARPAPRPSGRDQRRGRAGGDGGHGLPGPGRRRRRRRRIGGGPRALCGDPARRPGAGGARASALRAGPMMHVEIHGDGRRPYLLLVHGICSSRAQWRPNLAALAKVSTPVVVELLGHGRSQSPSDPEAYRTQAYIERFEALRAELGAERWAICGQSFGAGLTLNYALACPERISAQVATNSASGLGPARPALDEAVGRERAAAFVARGRSGLEAMAFYPKRTGRLAPDVEDELARDAELISLAAMAQTLTVTASGLSVADRLSEIAVPTLLVNGRREKSFQPLRDAAAARIPGVQVVDLEGGHPVNLDCAAGFDAAVTAFLEAAA